MMRGQKDKIGILNNKIELKWEDSSKKTQVKRFKWGNLSEKTHIKELKLKNGGDDIMRGQ